MLVLSKSKIMKILISIVLVIHIFSIRTFAMVSPTTEFYVNDYAKLLRSDTKNYIININQKLYNKTGAQIVVVTVPNLEGDSLEEYATALFRKFGIGDKTKNNGVLLLLALEERQFRIEVGYGLEGKLNDAKTGRIQDEYIIPYLKNNNWDEGIRNGFNAILQEVSDEYGVSIESAEAGKPKVSIAENKYGGVIMFILFLVSAIFATLTENNKKFGIIYAVYFIGGIIFLYLWESIRDFLPVFIICSIFGYIMGISFSGGGFSGSGGGFSGGGFSSGSNGSSSGGGGSSGGGRKFEKFLTNWSHTIKYGFIFLDK